uniref:Uncharacterized protein n=1 Tax=Onchocerca volvulus TaxID=6282 RepID=A0A8R1TQY1_ONCVO
MDNEYEITYLLIKSLSDGRFITEPKETIFRNENLCIWENISSDACFNFLICSVLFFVHL